MRDVKNSVVLNIRSMTDYDAVHITPYYRSRPDRAVVTQHYLSDYYCRWVYVNLFSQLWAYTTVFTYIFHCMIVAVRNQITKVEDSNWPFQQKNGLLLG